MRPDKNNKKISEMMRHYLFVKEQYEDCIVFYRLGDFYEMFFDDAVEVSRLLELTLTGKDCGLEERAPMCGIPFHAADSYIARLVALNKKVAICEQLSDPKLATGKKLVERDVIRVVTNGTITENSLVDDKSNNYIMSFYSDDKDFFGVAWADITTGDFLCEQINGLNAFYDSLYRINPAEIVCNRKDYDFFNNLPEAVKSSFPVVTLFDDANFAYKTCEKLLIDQFSVVNLDLYIPNDKKLAIVSAGALVAYLNVTQMRKVGMISRVTYFASEKHLILDNTALKNLEIVRSMHDGKTFGTLLWALDMTKTAGGARKLKEMLLSPLKDIEGINYRLDGVTDIFVDNMARSGIAETLGAVHDLERLCGRLSNGLLTPRDCQSIKKTLAAVPTLKIQLLGKNSKILQDISENLGDYAQVVDILERMIIDDPPVSTKEGGFIKDNFDEALDGYRGIQKNAKDTLAAMEARERNNTGIKNLKISYNKIFGYYIEVTNSYLSQVPYTYIRKQTLVGAERFVTEELKKFEEDILSSTENIVRTENKLFDKLKGVLEKNMAAMLKTAKCISMLDVIVSFAAVAKKKDYVRPEIVEAEKSLNIVAGRHPIVEAGGGASFIPNDTLLDNDENRMMIITGPNMAGKSTYMRQVALITIMAHVGAFVPAKSAEIPLTDRIFTRVGASDNLLFNQSTFMVEMTEVANILINATKDSLLILDEVGRGTSTFDGLSIAWAVVEYLCMNTKAKTLFATHYHELSELEGVIEGVKNYKISVKEINGEIMFLRRIMRGSANKSFGIEVAALAGIPSEVTARAKKILKSLEKNDITVKTTSDKSAEITERQTSFVEDYLKKIDLNNITPLKAFEILSFLKNKTEE